MISDRSALLGLAALLAAAVPAPAAQEALLERVRAALPAGDAQRVEALADEAERDGVPADLLFRKALEGAAKGVPAERILPAVEGYALRLREARELVGAGRDEMTLAVAAEAVRRGADPEAIRALAGRPEGDLAIPLLVLGELAEAGVPVEDALEVVTQALERGHGGERLLGVSAEVRHRIEAGELPAKAADEARRAVQERGASSTRGAGAPGRGTPAAVPPGGPPVPPGAGPPGRSGDAPGRNR